MAGTLNSRIGKVNLLAKNARTIRDSAFTALVKSIEEDKNYLAMRGIIVWQVPTVLSVANPEKCPFTGQEGKLVVIGGNQRYKALLALGYKEIEDRFLIEAKDAQGNWVSPEEAERIVVKDNSPEGIAGEFDYKKLFESYSTAALKVSGIDFSHFADMVNKATSPVKEKDPKEAASDAVEQGENGEKNAKLQEFIKHREETRRNLKEIDEAGFHLLLVFDSFEEKVDFISKSGLTGDKHVTTTDGDVYVDLVFESYAQKMEFIEKAGLSGEPKEDGSLDLVYDMFCDGRAFAAKFGISLKESGLHFRDMRVDAQLADLSRDDAPQMSEGEQQEALYEEVKKQQKSGGGKAS